METLNLVFGILIIILSIFIVVAVLMQSSKNRALSGVISGGAETFFGKKKAGDIEKWLNVATIIAAVLLCVFAIVVYILNPVIANNDKDADTNVNDTDSADDKTDDTTADDTTADDTTADDTTDAE